MSSDDVGYGFHPTEEEIVSYFLREKMSDPNSSAHIINTIDVCKYEPWELPRFANPITVSNRSIWYFFSPPDYKFANSKRANRTTKSGYWKITGQDRNVLATDNNEVIGNKKTLVFYQRSRGSKKGVKTNWVMQEFHSNKASLYHNPFVLCRVKHKSDGDSSTPEEGQIEATNTDQEMNPQYLYASNDFSGQQSMNYQQLRSSSSYRFNYNYSGTNPQLRTYQDGYIMDSSWHAQDTWRNGY